MGRHEGENSSTKANCPNSSIDCANSMQEVHSVLAAACLQPWFIVGIDFTKSNEWTGKSSFRGQSLHFIGGTPNPYENILRTLQDVFKCTKNKSVHCFGFGDKSTSDEDVFSFYSNENPCSNFHDALTRYREILQHVELAAPTSFAPIIEKALNVVEKSGGEYHVLFIIADGQVTRSADIEVGKWSPQEQKTVDAIIKASEYPLSIVLIGVGDGPWDTMSTFVDNIPQRVFNNFKFVNFTEMYSEHLSQPIKEARFAFAALDGLPSQYQAIVDGALLHRQFGKSVDRYALPPPSDHLKLFQSINFRELPRAQAEPTPTEELPFAMSDEWDTMACEVCREVPKLRHFPCGHGTCNFCTATSETCPICMSDS